MTFGRWLSWVALGFCAATVLNGLINGALWQAALGVLAPIVFVMARKTSQPAGLPGTSIHTPGDSLKVNILYGDDEEIWDKKFGKD